MEINYFGLSSFRLKGAAATVVTDPYNKDTGLKLAKMSAEIVTVSHDHFDHNNVEAVSGTSKRSHPLIIRAPGEYEAKGVAVYCFSLFHFS